MADQRDLVDIQGLSPQPASLSPAPTGQTPRSGRFLSLWFSCANRYGRAYPNAGKTEYCGRCGKCGKTISFPIGHSGTSQRMFEVRCD